MSYRKVKTGNARRQGAASQRAVSGAGRKKGGNDSKKVLFVIVALLLIGFVGSIVAEFVYSPSRGKCKEMISDFQEACNKQDVNGILNCLKPSVSNPLKVAFGIGSVVTSQSSDEMFESILDALGGGLGGITEKTGLSIRSLFETIEIKPVRFGFPGKTRKVRCRAFIGGLERQIYIYVTKQYGESYISKVAFAED